MSSYNITLNNNDDKYSNVGSAINTGLYCFFVLLCMVFAAVFVDLFFCFDWITEKISSEAYLAYLVEKKLKDFIDIALTPFLFLF